jgi:hypothetical protein
LNSLSAKRYLFILSTLLLLTQVVPGIGASNTDRNPDAWLQTETEHFTFIFKEKDGSAVDEILNYAEDVYRDITTYFDSYPEEIRCIILGNSDEPSGYFSPVPPHHMGLGIHAPTYPLAGSKTESWLELVFTHELTHYIHLTSEYGTIHAFSRIFGNGISSAFAFFLPGWMTEGIAVEFETLYTAGGRGRNPFFEMLYKAPVIEDRFFTLKQSAYPSAFPPKSRIYTAGYLLVNYMMEVYGTEIFQSIHNEFLRFPFFGPWRAIRNATGSPASEIFEAMQTQLKQKYDPYKDFPEGERFSPDAVGDYYFPKTTERGLLTYRYSLTDPAALVFIDKDSGEEKLILQTVLTDPSSFSSSETGSTIAFSSVLYEDYGPNKETELSRLYLFFPESNELKILPSGTGCWHPALSPDGTRLVAVQGLGTYNRLIEIDLESGDISVLYEEEKTRIFNPVFSPAGDKIAFVKNTEGIQDIFLIDTDNGDGSAAGPKTPAPLFTIDQAGDYFPNFLKNGDVLFSSDREGFLALYKTSIDSGRTERIVRDPVAAIAGIEIDDKILYTSYSSKGYCLKKTAAGDIENSVIDMPLEEGHLDAPKSAHSNVQTGIDSLPKSDMEPGSFTTGPYRDLPKPSFWLPYPSLISTSKNITDLGFGAYIHAVSTLQNWTWSLSAAFHPSVLQPAGDFNLTFNRGRVSYIYSFRQDYNAYDSSLNEYQQETTLEAALRYSILSDYVLGRGRKIGFQTGLTYTRAVYDTGDFPLTIAVSPSGMKKSQEFELFGSLNMNTYKIDSRKALYPRTAFDTHFECRTPVPLSAEDATGVTALTGFNLSVPGFFPAQSIKSGTKLSYSSMSLVETRPFKPRGFSTEQEQTIPGTYLTCLEYQFTIALTDLPLIRGMYLLGLAGALHIEQGGEWQVTDGFLQNDPYPYLGIEIVSLLGYNAISLPLGIGLNYSIDPANRANPFRGYIFFGYNSFMESSYDF